MRILISPGCPLATVFRSLCAIALLFGAMAGTCQDPGDDETPPPGQAPPGAPVVTIIAPLFDRNIATGAIITITYSVDNSPDNVIAFIDPDSDPENGNEVIFAEQLFGGANRTANFATEGIVSGVYNFGIQASNSAGTDTEYARSSAGQLVKITVNGLPQPALNAPSSDVEILFNTTTSVPLAFSCNDFENDVSWEVFYDTNQVIDGTEVTIASGTGNADPGSTNVTVDWLTFSIPEGVYSIGLLCTDSANSAAFAYAAGQVTITSELSVPTITLTQPAEDLTVFTDTDINIAFAAGNTSVQGATITLFLDTDDSGFDGTEPRIATELPLTATSVTVNSNIIPEGVYFIGGIVELGGRRSDARYAPGQLTVIGTGDITVVQPADPLTVTPGTDVVIRWNTNLPSGEGLIDLALFQSDILGNPGAPVSPDPLADAKGLEITPPTAVLNTITLTTGFYVVEVTLTPTGQSPDSALSVPIRITTQPTVLWLGSIEQDEDGTSAPAHFDGVIFEGLQFEDNAGTNFLAVGNIDGQAGDDFIIGARFAKPLLNNAAGVGSGEAYLLYSDGRVNRSNRRWSLNATGADMGESNDPNALPGLLFFGVRFDPRSEDIDSNSILTPGCFTENRQFDGGKLDQWDEDVNGNGVLDEYEDIDLDGFMDINEDGTLWPDFNCDGLADNFGLTAPHFFDAQYINGYLDTGIVEDRDGDGVLDIEGDDTGGLTSLGLVPDADEDGLPEIVLGFEHTDSVKPGRPTDHAEPPGMGTLVQPNQFERGGIVIVPTFHNQMIGDPSFPGRFNNDRIMELDRVGQEFYDVEYGNPIVGNCCGTHAEGGCNVLAISDCVCTQMPICCYDDNEIPGAEGWNDDCIDAVDDMECATCDFPPPPGINAGPGIVGNAPAGRPESGSGMDAYPLMFDTVSSQAQDVCGPDQFGLYVINNTQPQESLVAVPNLLVNGDLNQPAPMAGTIKTQCFDCDPGQTANVQLGSVVLDVLETGEIVYIIPEPDTDTNRSAVCGESIIVGINGPDENGDYDSLFVCDGDVEDDECDPLALGIPFGCETVSGPDGCFENLAGPLFGFSYAGLTGGNSSFEDPSHPLAYDQTLSNPHVRADLFANLAGPCNGSMTQNICGHVHGVPDLLRNSNGAPPFNVAASGFYPGAIEEDGPLGARILGQGVGDRFGKAISMTPSPAESIVFVSAPNRTINSMPGAGAVYQWQMHQYWHRPFSDDTQPPLPLPDLSNGLSAIDGFGGIPKPYQYIIKDLGFDTPNNRIDDVEGSLKFALTYTGADAGDELGATILGITDFNGDALDDLLIGAPGADGANNAFPDSGAVYIVYRRPPTIEGEAIDLTDVARDRNDPNRLNGMLINGEAGSRMGEALAANCDLNGDGTNDIVIGSPDALTGRGEVIIVFGSPDPDADYLPSPAEGYSVQELVDAGHAVRIQGAFDDDQAGFNVICNGDFDGDGQNDLVISAPFAEPMFDSDGDDVLDTPGLDLNRDGQIDLDENGLPLLNDPTEAGVVYVIINTDQLSGVHNLSEIGAALQGFIFAGLNGGDQLGGGRETKRNTRSQGLSFAGDVDGDGKDDVLIGAIFADPNNKTNAGEVYLIYGFTASQAADF